jgi:hypothetical protein
MCHKHTSLSPINCQSVDNCCIIINTLNNHHDPILFTCKGVKQINNRISLNMTFTFTIRISLRFSSAREFQMGNFQKYWSQNVGQNLFVLFFTAGRFWKLTGGTEGTFKSGRILLPPKGSHVFDHTTTCIISAYHH